MFNIKWWVLIALLAQTACLVALGAIALRQNVALTWQKHILVQYALNCPSFDQQRIYQEGVKHEKE